MADQKEYHAYGFLEELPLERLEELLTAASTGEEDTAYLDAVISAILKKEENGLPDIDQAWADFQQYRAESGDTPLFPSDEPADGKTVSQRPVRFRKLIRLGLAAALVVILLFGTMAVAQAAGWDVLGTVARWTDNIFSFGEIQSDGAVDTPKDSEPAGDDSEAAFTSLQDALDAYGITEVSEPAWFPERYVFRNVAVDCWSNGDLIGLTAEYFHETSALFIEFKIYQDEPNMQIEKTDSPVETLAVNDIIVYLLENTNSNSAAWVTEHYECFIGGAVEKDELRKMVLSAYEKF